MEFVFENKTGFTIFSCTMAVFTGNVFILVTQAFGKWVSI